MHRCMPQLCTIGRMEEAANKADGKRYPAFKEMLRLALPLMADAALAEKVNVLADLPLVVVLLHRDHIPEIVASEGWRTTVRRAEVGPPVSLSDKVAVGPASLPPAAAPTGKGIQPPAAGGRRAVIGVIDQGIAFAHERLRNKSGSRVAYLWQQEFLVPFSPTALGNEIACAQIENALDTATGDEESVYRSLGGLRFDPDGYKPLAHARTHGTSVLDIAAGAPPGEDVTTMPVIAVDLPERAIGDPAGSTLTPHALWGLVYLLERATAMVRPGETLPVIANISYGPHEGPHDGTTLFEQYADLLIEQTSKTQTPLRIVLAAGNFRQSRVHACAVVPPARVDLAALAPAAVRPHAERSGTVVARRRRALGHAALADERRRHGVRDFTHRTTSEQRPAAVHRALLDARRDTGYDARRQRPDPRCPVHRADRTRLADQGRASGRAQRGVGDRARE